ncbi:MAG: hypothetical protein LBI49_17875 [Nocardiopsaceae bacterium]|jgi:hypothetical protein|nr:hypothetical protein [Nocardiopsaceae bacterium]
MSDLRRLGKRGSYRLGKLGTPPPEQGGPPPPHYPSFAPGRRWPLPAWLLGGLAWIAVIAVAAALGWWFVPFLAGAGAGVAARYGRLRLRVALPLTALGAAAGWAVPLWWAAASGQPVGAVAREVAALAGLPPHAAVIIVVALLVPALQAACGLWLAFVAIPRQGGR